MPFGVVTQVGPRNHVLDVGADPQGDGAMSAPLNTIVILPVQQSLNAYIQTVRRYKALGLITTQV